MNDVYTVLQYFVVLLIELSLLFILITALVHFILSYLPPEKIRNLMAKRKKSAYFIGAGFGALTPFCACSTIPMTVGLLRAQAPFGAVISFLVASPLLNPIVLTMMIALMGWQTTLIYGAITFAAAIFFGVLLQLFNFGKYVKNVVVKGEKEDNSSVLSVRVRIREALANGWDGYRGIFFPLLFGVAVGSVIKGFVPAEFIVRIAGPGNPLAVPTAAVVGIPLYLRASTILPIGFSLLGKGMSVGAVMALVIGGAGMAIPEMSLLAGIFKGKLVAAVVATIFITAVVTGFVFNLINSGGLL